MMITITNTVAGPTPRTRLIARLEPSVVSGEIAAMAMITPPTTPMAPFLRVLDGEPSVPDLSGVSTFFVIANFLGCG
ncbi:hypothetical protein GCM10025762_18580 [Haloechinothrix salitolerans]